MLHQTPSATTTYTIQQQEIILSTTKAEDKSMIENGVKDTAITAIPAIIDEKSISSSPQITPKWKEKRDKRREAQKYLAGQYSKTKQILDVCVSCLWLGFGLRLYSKVLLLSLSSVSSLCSLFVVGICAAIVADFLSGMLHWGCDTWGTLNTPFIGKSLIRSFREHHVDPTAITRHPFSETNGNSLLVTLPFIIAFSFVEPTPFITFLSMLAVWLSFTNQIHKWAHTYQPPRIVMLLQQYRVILQGRNHNYHHFSPYDRDYCITNGWLNPIFQKFDLWRKMEQLVIRYTGAKPREDDALWTQQTVPKDVKSD